MTRNKKRDEILKRLKDKGIEFDTMHLSVMTIIGYLNDLNSKGMLQNEMVITESGKQVTAICEEFQWEPSDNEIFEFVANMIAKEEQTMVAYILKEYRDHREKLIKEFEDYKNSQTKLDAE